MKYQKLKNKDYDSCIINHLKIVYDLEPDVAHYVYHLGYRRIEDIKNFLQPQSTIFHSPFMFNNMQAVVDKIYEVMGLKQRIVIFGDYDVDGIGATYIFIKYFESMGANVNYFLPSRDDDGYGLTKSAIDKVIEMFDPQLIITVDCGITAVNEVEYIKSKGIDVIITDHHEPLEVLPDCLIIDAKVPNENYPFRNLCGTAVALKVVCALSNENPDVIKKFMPVTALSTIADIVELQDENRYIVKQGLLWFEKFIPEGVAKLVEKCALKQFPSEKDISFKIAPKINATGRLGDASVGLKLYLANNASESDFWLNKVMDMNTKRHQICDNINAQIFSLLEKQQEKGAIEDIIILQDSSWESSVLGIVCSKIVEKYKRPAILLGKDKISGGLTGSARSYANFNIHQALIQCESVLEHFGGHQFACGLTIKQENFDKLKQMVLNYAKENSSDLKEEENKIYHIDVEDLSIFNVENYIYQAELLSPFGNSNPEPMLRAVQKACKIAPMNKHPEHLIINVGHTSVVYFNSWRKIYTLSLPIEKDIYFHAEKDNFRNDSKVKISIEDIHCNIKTQFTEEICKGSKLLTRLLTHDRDAQFYPTNQFENSTSGKTVFVSYCNGKEVLNYSHDEVNYVYLYTLDVKNVLLISPLDFENMESIQSLVFVEALDNDNIVKFLNNKYPNMKIYADVEPKNTASISFAKLEQIRDVLLKVDQFIFDEIYLFKRNFSRLSISFSEMIIAINLLKNINVYTECKQERKFTCSNKPINKSDVEKAAKLLYIDIL